MHKPVLILGGYGNFGKRIAEALARHQVSIVIAGRSAHKATALQQSLNRPNVQTACFDIENGLDQAMSTIKPSVVIDTCGPFQSRNYHVAHCCMQHRVHYIDLADDRGFVTGISKLDSQACKKSIAIISGASTVPGLSSAVLERFKSEFAVIDKLNYGISLGQKTERGLATTQAILSYVGKRLQSFPGDRGAAYGWQDLHRINLPKLGHRWMANCEIPDLDLFPERYGIRSIRFSAGLESGTSHLGLWALSWFKRAGLPLDLTRLANALLRISHWFDRFGSANGCMAMQIEGRDHDGNAHRRRWFILAFNGHGPYIPTVPAIILARKLALESALGRTELIGAKACVGLVALDEYLDELKGYDIETLLE